MPEPSWWHRSHPTFAGLVGFFTGVAYVIVVPGVYAALLGLLVSDATAQKLFPLVLVALVIPIALLVPAQDAEVRAVHVPRHRQHGPRGRGDRRAGHLGDDPARRLTAFLRAFTAEISNAAPRARRTPLRHHRGGSP